MIQKNQIHILDWRAWSNNQTLLMISFLCLLCTKSGTRSEGFLQGPPREAGTSWELQTGSIQRQDMEASSSRDLSHKRPAGFSCWYSTNDMAWICSLCFSLGRSLAFSPRWPLGGFCTLSPISFPLVICSCLFLCSELSLFQPSHNSSWPLLLPDGWSQFPSPWLLPALSVAFCVSSYC